VSVTAADRRPAGYMGAVELDRVKLSFGGVIRCEWIKFFSLKSTYLVLALFVVCTAGFSAIEFVSIRGYEWAASIHVSETIGQFASLLGTLIIGILGVQTVTNEYSSGMIRSTFTAVPKRVPVFFAKSFVLIVVGLLTTALTIAISYGVAWLALRDTGTDLSLTADQNWRVNLGIGLYIVTFAILGLWIGTLVRSGPGSMAIIVVFAFVLPVLAELLRTIVIATAQGTYALWHKLVLYFIECLPTAAGSHIMEWDPAVTDDLTPSLHLTEWTGFAVMWVWVALFAIPAIVRLRTRDA
jgi:ABC-2 type transport system permease protein